MEHYYHYFVSTLPILRLFEAAPWSSEEFLAECSRQLSADDFKLLEATKLIPQNDVELPPETMSFAWNNFERQLRNRIVRQLSGSSGDTMAFERDSKGCFPEVDLAVSEAWSQNNPLEREKVLDRWRWRFLDDQEGRKPFGAIGFVCMYKIKLQIVEKWDRRQVEAGQTNLAQVLKECGTINEEEK